MKYNVNDGKYAYDDGSYAESGVVEYYGSTSTSISLEYLIPQEETDANVDGPVIEGGYVVDEVYYEKTNYVHLDLGPDCENVINKLIELGIIESVEHIWWGSAEELLK